MSVDSYKCGHDCSMTSTNVHVLYLSSGIILFPSPPRPSFSCSPPLLQGDDYIMYCHPSAQKTPRSDRLRAWYLDMLKDAKSKGIVAHLSTLWDTYFEGGRDHRLERCSATHIPYLEGDYWHGESGGGEGEGDYWHGEGRGGGGVGSVFAQSSFLAARSSCDSRRHARSLRGHWVSTAGPP